MAAQARARDNAAEWALCLLRNLQRCQLGGTAEPNAAGGDRGRRGEWAVGEDMWAKSEQRKREESESVPQRDMVEESQGSASEN